LQGQGSVEHEERERELKGFIAVTQFAWTKERFRNSQNDAPTLAP
jgi:hypothetical protein